ncbi:hypothetical protein BFJ72_g11186 [Fusarium proliferatum]|uniref:ABC transporter domain-containing protein n=1 Tax=Gibberella intermedia TaxID=948311 RepID=A0A420SPF8_GIBIN|nr:hypothetical protein BFJ72_g11186 [Fusarium proliferatum]
MYDILQQDPYHVVVSVASVVATALLCPLLYLEHVRSTRPADLAVIFLLVSLVCDLGAALQEGPEEWLIPTTKITLKFLLIAAESRSKQGILKSPYSFQSPEQLAGILSRTCFWWINPILALGNQIILSGEDLPPIDHLLTSEKLRHDGLKAWDQRARPLTKITLPICLVKSMLPQFMVPVVLRLCLIFFRYAQPALISSAVHELSSHSDGGRLMLIMKAAMVYCGLAVFEAVYHHRLNRLSIITKGTLIGLINNAALRQSSSSYNDGIALTLISTDTESVMRFSTNALGIFSPILTFVIFVMYANVRGSTLDAETAFTTTALLGLVTHPANMIMTIVPRAIGSLAAFGRIQDYLVRPGRADERRLFKPKTKVDDSSSAICFEAVTVQSHSQSRAVLDNINFTVNQGSIVICAGAVGSGKTVLAQCILGEIPASSGTISVSTQRIAYCEQSPWLPSGTLKEVVCGFGKFEPGWYRHVVKLCCLDEDILALPLGDNTVIGSRGLKLSGGQRQRLALARALYARGEIVLLDDSFSALDHNTERKVVSNLLGTQGHFRKTGTTVVLIANSTKHFDLADSLIILESGRVTYQGSPNAVNEEVAHLRQMNVNVAVAETNTGLVKTNKTIQSQALEVTEAVADLGRSTGDFTLYDKSQQPAYILLCLQTWLNIVLDLVIASMAVILIALAVFLEGSTTAGQIGMSLNIVLVANSTLLALVTSWTNLEISLGAISRLKTLEEETVAEEQPVCGGVVPETWPSRGALQVHDLMVSYEETHVPALKNISLSIEPGQHLVICGRTGSGKSTLLLAFLRLLDTQSGSIEVDGIDLSQVPLSTIRERCFIIVTQDPFLLAQASLRFNLDPSETLSDIVILKSLERTGLCGHFDTHVQAKLADILDSPLSSLPHMSTGQTQLFALTRALLRAEHCSITGTKPILLLDEATSSVDGLTESTMRRVVKEAFTDNGHTVIEITHRLSGLKDIAQTAGHNPEVSVVLLSQGGIQRQGRIEDMLDFGNES